MIIIVCLWNWELRNLSVSGCCSGVDGKNSDIDVSHLSSWCPCIVGVCIIDGLYDVRWSGGKLIQGVGVMQGLGIEVEIEVIEVEVLWFVVSSIISGQHLQHIYVCF